MKAPHRTRLLPAAYVAAMVICCTHMASAVTVRTVALSGQTAPGTGSGVTFDYFFGLALGASGKTAFQGVLSDETNRTGIWSEDSGTLALAAREGGQAAGTESGVKYRDLETTDLLIDAAGQAVFAAELTGDGVDSSNDEAIWSESSGAPALVARKGSHAPGTSSGVNFGGLTFYPVLNAAGQIAFTAGLTGSGVDNTNNRGIWSERSGSLDIVVRSGSQAPGADNGENFFFFSDIALNASGRTAFQAGLDGGGVDSTNLYGIWSEGSGALELVAREGSHAPGTPNGVHFGEQFANSPFFGLRLNAAGQTAFSAQLMGAGVVGENSQGIWSEGSGALDLVARTGAHAPGTGNGVEFAYFTDLEFDDAGQTSFGAVLTGSGVDDTNYQGLWSDGSGTLALVARTGNQAPGTANGVNFAYFSGLEFNAAGQMAFAAGLSGSGVDETNDYGIWATNALGIPELVVRKGDSLEVAPGDIRIVSSLGSVLGRGDGHPSGFNDLGQLAFSASFVDGSTGIFVTDTSTGDFDNDGDVDGRDFLLWQRGGSPNPLSASDLANWRANYGVGSLAASIAVPESSTLTFLTILLLSAFAESRNPQRHAQI